MKGLCRLCSSPPKHVGLRYLLFLLLFGFVACGSVPLKLVGPEGPLLAVAGQDLVLPCSFRPSNDTHKLSVIWHRINGDIQTHIHVHRNGTDHNKDQSHDYHGRTSLFLDEISTGNVSLKLSDVRLSDVGRYQCTVDAGDGNYSNADMEVQVKVIGTEPTIFTDGRQRTQLNLRCISSGWSPQPVIDWLNVEGRNMPAEPTESHAEASGTFRVERRLLVDWNRNSSSSSYHCRVTLGDVVKTTQRNVTGEEEEEEAEEKQGLNVKMIIAVVCGVVAALVTGFMWFRGNGRLRERAFNRGETNRLRNAHPTDGLHETAPVLTG